MDDPRQIGRELADGMIPKLEARSVTGVESARIVALQISSVAGKALEAGEAQDGVAGWFETALIAYLDRLRERIQANDALIAKADGEPSGSS